MEFTVTREVPPRRIGARSIWAARTEVPRIVALRETALRTMRGGSLLRGEISLIIEVHVPWTDVYSSDLGDVVKGVCESLSRAHPRSKLSSVWGAPELALIHPTICVAVVDSAEVTFLYAEKVSSRGEPWYRIILNGER